MRRELNIQYPTRNVQCSRGDHAFGAAGMMDLGNSKLGTIES